MQQCTPATLPKSMTILHKSSNGECTFDQLTVDDHGYVHKVDLPTGLHAGLAAVNALIRLRHLVDLQVVVWQHLEPAFTGGAEGEHGDKRTTP